jgi:hypothetical protein
LGIFEQVPILARLIARVQMQSMSLADSVHTYLIPCLADVLAGFGLGALLEFSGTSPDMPYFLLVCITALLVAGVAELLLPPCRKLPPWLALCNATYSLVVTLALTLNLLAQLCPPTGRDLCLIPVYVLMCVPRAQPTGRALVLQAGAAVLLLLVFTGVPTASGHARADGDTGSQWMLFVSFLAGTSLQTFSFQSEAIELQLVRPSRLWRAGAVVCKGLLLLAAARASDTYLYSFMFDRPGDAPVWLSSAFGVLLLFSCMQTASAWFGQLRDALGQRVKWRLVVRIQHVIHALLVAAAWVFPLQMHGLRVLLMAGLLWVNLVRRLYLF